MRIPSGASSGASTADGSSAVHRWVRHSPIRGGRSGIVPGGGVTLIRAQKALDKVKGADADEEVGVRILRKALEEPLRLIVQNSGGEGSVVLQAIRDSKEPRYGYDAEAMKYGDMVELGIVDPAKVTRAALENAASIAGMILTTESMMTEIKEDTPAMPLRWRLSWRRSATPL